MRAIFGHNESRRHHCAVFAAIAIGALTLLCQFAASTQAAPPRIKLLFLGDEAGHRPADRFRELQPVLAQRGIELTYTGAVNALNPKTLASYDGLVIYANTTRISPEQEQALLDYVASGKGFIPLHCASYCFLNSQPYIDLVGAQFLRHGTGVFRTTVAAPDHPIMKGFQSFECWDETYVHTKHNPKDRVVLEYRTSASEKEPWTWVRTHGKGRVFYTAWGHDARTWNNPGFHNLVERGIRWTVGGDPSVVPPFADRPAMTQLSKDVKPFEYVPAKVPFYPASPRWGVTGDPITKMQVPLPPDESMKHIVHPADFELKLFVSEPEIQGKPICMNWDERGRLWIALTVDYPNEMQPKGSGRDRIVICEDTDGDGRADKFTVFADKISIPTSMTFYRGGVIVTQAPDTLYLKDTDGDGVADERRVLFSGWGTRDTHAGPSNLRYGLDNWIYGMVGYSGFRGRVGSESHSFAQGFFRFRPDGSQAEFLRNTNNNSWGVGISEEGIIFGSTANGVPSVYLPIPNRYYESVRGWSPRVLTNIAFDAEYHPITDKVRQVDWHGKFTAGAGHALYTARSYPPEYWNRTAFVSDPTGHLTAAYVLQPQGADFTSRYAWNLLASDDEWVSPIMAEVGPDGNMWIIDWYSFIVQHNPTPPGFRTGKGAAYETNLRDKKHGRIYRLVPKNGKPAAPVDLHGASTDKLLANLANDNMFWRLHAQRLLVERGQTDIAPALIKLTADSSCDAIGLNPGAIHALWTLHGLGLLDGAHAEATAAAVKALRHPSAGVRRNAVAVLPRSSDGVKAILAGGVLNDADAQVRMAALLALADMPAHAEAGSAIVAFLAKPENNADRWIPEAATSAAATHAFDFLKAAASGKSPPSRVLDVIRIVAEHYARSAPTQTAGSLMTALAQADPRMAEVILESLARGWPADKPAKLSADGEEALAKLLASAGPGAKGHLLRLATRWGSQRFEKYTTEIATALMSTVVDAKRSDEARATAAKQLVDLRNSDAQIVTKLLDLITPQTPPHVTVGIIEALRNSQAPSMGAALVERFGAWTPAARQAALQVLLSRPDSTRVLLESVEKGQVNLNDLALDQKQALAAYPDRKIAAKAKELLAKGGGLPNPDREKVFQQLLPLTKKDGQTALGKVVFTNQCAKCHRHNGEGNAIGPDLTGMAVHSKEHLLTDIVDPSRNVEGNFRVYNVETKDGRVISGLMAAETKTTVELLDAENKRHVILRENIAELTVTPKSIMPEGFEKQLSADDIVNLLAFLTQRGKYLPLPLAKAATAVSTRGMFTNPDAAVERLAFTDWSPKTFSGVPFQVVDPQNGRVPNVVLLYGPHGSLPPKMPKSVTLPCNAPAKAIHFLSGVSGWGYPYSERGSVSMIVRLHYADGKTEDHPLINGTHFADYIRVVDVPGSKLAFRLRGQQIRYLSIEPKRRDKIEQIELVKGPDDTAPVVMAVTVEGPE